MLLIYFISHTRATLFEHLLSMDIIEHDLSYEFEQNEEIISFLLLRRRRFFLNHRLHHARRILLDCIRTYIQIQTSNEENEVEDRRKSEREEEEKRRVTKRRPHISDRTKKRNRKDIHI